MDTTLLVFLGAVFVLSVAGTLGLLHLVRPRPERQRLQRLGGEAVDDTPAGRRWLRVVERLTRPLSTLAQPDEGLASSNVRARFAQAGIRSPSAPTSFFGLKTLLTLALPLLALLLALSTGTPLTGQGTLAQLLALAALGYYAPNLVLSQLVQRRQGEIFDSFPDALDLLTVCVEAGLGIDAALARVADDIQIRSQALAEELRLVNLELRAGGDRSRALRNLASRTGVDEIDSFVTLLVQAERFGTSIGDSLRMQSELMRTRRHQRAEEAAAKVGLKLLFPLIFCIFPALLVVLMGPAMIQMVRTLSGISIGTP